MIAYARRRLATAPVPITLTQASVEALPFSDELFDSVVATQSLHCVERRAVKTGCGSDVIPHAGVLGVRDGQERGQPFPSRDFQYYYQQ